jgi:hypothetical protein
VEGAKVTLDPSRMPRCEDYKPVISGISIQPVNGSSVLTGDALQAVVGDTLIIDGDNLMPSNINCFDSIKSPQMSGTISRFGINLKSKLANTNMGFASDGTSMIFSPDARKVRFVIPRGVNENDSSRTFTVSVQNDVYSVGSYTSQDTTQTVTVKNNP